MRQATDDSFRLSPVKSMLASAWIFGLVVMAGCDNNKNSPGNFEAFTPESSQVAKPNDAATSLKPKRLTFVEEGSWKKEVMQSGEPVVVDFWADWCSHCRTMGPIMESLAKDYKTRRVDVDTNAELASIYQVSTIPRLLIFQNGKLVYEYIGIPSESTVRAELQKLTRQ